MERTKEQIQEMLSLAKLCPDDLLPTTQTIYFASNLHKHNEYKFIQLNPKLEATLKAGDVLHINGEQDDNAVLCTEDTTYELLHSETSNSLLLVKDLKLRDTLAKPIENSLPDIHKVPIEGIFYDYLEAVHRKPQLSKLKNILEETTYKGPELEYEVVKSKLYTFEDLWLKEQASKAELKAALHEMQVITVDGKLRLLDFEYHFRVLSFMLKIIDENSWPLDEVDFEVTVETLNDLVPLDVLTSVFELYTVETKVRDGTQLYRYKEFDVCQFFAQVLLYSAGKFNLKDFLQAWQESVPEGMITDEEMLYGIAIVDRKANPSVVWSFPESKLPQNINERFKVLFDTKEKWRVNEIAPYIKNLTNDKQDVNALLTKHARPSKIDGVKYYSSKHAK
ncbi:sister chromatid cohesion protein DCC1-like [Atheta coriaria]|uniref:sister chromatid cohesion protein DCC1-like n=1 Tax=Dalotia coriaria TaxID=877792 RepID=UPI0031F40D41